MQKLIEDGVNYYRRYIGDFQADTMALSMMEQGAYDRLLDYYYAGEQPIPLNKDRAAIICRAVTLEERAAVDTVLHGFFTREDDGWHNQRADRELAISLPVIEVQKKNARANGTLGGRPKKNPEITQMGSKRKPRNNPDGFQKETQTITQTITQNEPRINQPPTTNHQPNTNNTTSFADANYSAGFVRFWEAWPKSKRKLRKFNAWRVWEKLKLDPIADRIVAHVTAARDSQHWRDGFDPMPETFLNQRRWDDDLNPGSERLVI